MLGYAPKHDTLIAVEQKHFKRIIKMEAAWNRIDLERPPNATWRVENRKFDSTAFLATLEKIIHDLESQQMLHAEAAILSRLIYRMKSKFRNDKGLKGMSKVNRALLNYLSLSLNSEYKNLKSYVESDGKYINLPSRQMVEYVLVRTQGFSKLLLRLDEVASHSAHFLKTRMSSGHAWSISVIAYAVVSRIWLLSRHLIKNVCEWYNNLHQHLKLFETVGVNWLSKNDQLPVDLKSWLALPWIDEPIRSSSSDQQLKDTIFKLITRQESDSNEDTALNAQKFDNEQQSSNTVPTRREGTFRSSVVKNKDECIIPMDDTGEVISRRTLSLKHVEGKNDINTDEKEGNKTFKKALQQKKEKEQSQGPAHSKTREISLKNKKRNDVKREEKTFSQKPLTIHNVKTKSELMIVLAKESHPDVDKLQWNMIKNKSKKLIVALDACSDEKKQLVLFEKGMKRIRRWIV